MFVHQMGIQIYDQISILIKWSEVKLYPAFSLDLGLKGVQITRNIAKVGIHSCLSNGHPNLWSNFNSKNLVKRQTPSYNFDKVWLKGGENTSEHHEIWHALLSTKWATKYTIKFYFQEIVRAFSLRLHLKGVKIARNIMKLGVHGYLLKWVPKSTFKFQF